MECQVTRFDAMRIWSSEIRTEFKVAASGFSRASLTVRAALDKREVPVLGESRVDSKEDKRSDRRVPVELVDVQLDARSVRQ